MIIEQGSFYKCDTDTVRVYDITSTNYKNYVKENSGNINAQIKIARGGSFDNAYFIMNDKHEVFLKDISTNRCIKEKFVIFASITNCNELFIAEPYDVFAKSFTKISSDINDITHDMILAIDPGSTESGIVVLDRETLKPYFAEKLQNEEIMSLIYSKKGYFNKYSDVAIEMIASYGMPVGVEVFETCVWIGRMKEAINNIFSEIDIKYIYRKDEKMNLCHSMKANDSTIKQALVDRFTPGQKNYGKGVKKHPGWFYGFAKDIWAAYAVGVTYKDKYISKIYK